MEEDVSHSQLLYLCRVVQLGLQGRCSGPLLPLAMISPRGGNCMMPGATCIQRLVGKHVARTVWLANTVRYRRMRRQARCKVGMQLHSRQRRLSAHKAGTRVGLRLHAICTVRNGSVRHRVSNVAFIFAASCSDLASWFSPSGRIHVRCPCVLHMFFSSQAGRSSSYCTSRGSFITT